LLTHGVGLMRKYCIGAVLLDLNDPTKVIGRLREPLLTPEDDELEGYVSNVIYTCGCAARRKYHVDTAFMDARIFPFRSARRPETEIPFGISDRPRWSNSSNTKLAAPRAHTSSPQ
jgi:hypothetical protein